MSLKERISSPLEAGISVLDAHQLPPRLTTALEHASSRLARKALHITLVVVRRDYQLPHQFLPTALPTPTSPEFCQTPLSAASSSSSTSGSRFGFASTLKQLVRTGSLHDIASSTAGLGRSNDSVRSNMSSPAFLHPGELASPRFRWPLSPLSPTSVPPMTPATATSTTTDVIGQESLDGFGIRLVHDGSLTPRMEKSLRLTLHKTEKLFNLGREWLAPAVSPAAYGLSRQLIQRSIVQNDVLFSSEGLTLVSLDRLYSLKSALSSYSRTNSALRLEDAVDELRRLVLANNGAKVPKADLLRSFDWLSVSDTAMVDLDQMYRRAYGGPSQSGGIEGMRKPVGGSRGVAPEPVIRDAEYETDEELDWVREEAMEIGVALTSTTPAGDPPAQEPAAPKPPLLKLQTNFLVKPKPVRKQLTGAGGPGGAGAESKKVDIRIEIEDEEEDGDRTARPADEFPIMFQSWGGSIDQILSADALSPQRSSMRMGPMTPNGYEDISPITRGEWGFLMVDDKFQSAKTVKVETC
ncbi:hypothetical protein NLU13_7003 [Sarocladium strictum]|uniref:DUF7582 domain-containing protein n=1 Tax=Sarocladium strictum TaxID=5046 RepID=A0AA39GF10_SARSR|nr:hypothetical protein NLU13_7003 [Sarocladium strictum]